MPLGTHGVSGSPVSAAEQSECHALREPQPHYKCHRMTFFDTILHIFQTSLFHHFWSQNASNGSLKTVENPKKNKSGKIRKFAEIVLEE